MATDFNGEPESQAFKIAVVRSLLKLQLAIVAIAGVYDRAAQLLCGAATFSVRSKQTKEVLSACLEQAKVAYDNINQAWKAIEPSAPPRRWEVFDPSGSVIKPSTRERAAGGLLLAYTILDAFINEMTHLLQEQTDDSALWENLDAIPTEIQSVLERVHAVFTDDRLLAEFAITNDGNERLPEACDKLQQYVDAAQAARPPLTMWQLTERSGEVLRPLVTQITSTLKRPAGTVDDAG